MLVQVELKQHLDLYGKGFKIRRPKYSDCKDENDEFDSECFEDAMSQYEDFKRDEYLERQAEIGDQIHEQRKDEKDE